ncbi:hypothetical protein HPB48_024984 [Haemaphysalis longicornis]|uniref:Cyclin-like domain-containing protein n=1 Tax=Haemaphysalis longicornis TaxID=44386 RepID=A0A9J6H736_HAELO|nr:hypothetical protein HPB48_024984 [Haemaphysalis longicornis]
MLDVGEALRAPPPGAATCAKLSDATSVLPCANLRERTAVLKRVRLAVSAAAAMSIQSGLTADSAISLVQQYLRKEQLHWRPSTYASQVSKVTPARTHLPSVVPLVGAPISLSPLSGTRGAGCSRSSSRVPVVVLLAGEEITSVQRNHTVKWLTVLNRYLKFNPETLFLSVTLMDEFLLLVRAQPKYLKCIAVSCFYLASKIIEEDEASADSFVPFLPLLVHCCLVLMPPFPPSLQMVPHIKDLIKNCDCIFSVSEITRMEAVILKKLKWDLCRATSLDFLHGTEQQLAALGPLLEAKLQICLDQASLAGSRPSTLALALVSLELETWTPNWFVITIALQRLVEVSPPVPVRGEQSVPPWAELR